MTDAAKDKPHLLIVEDEKAIATGLNDVFIYHGYHVTVASDGERGLQEALSGRYDLILLDIMLPKRDGYEVCEQVRMALPEQPIIMLTARLSDDDIVQGLRLGADDYVTKPFSVEQLVLRVAAVLRRVKNEKAKTAHQITLGDWLIDTQNLQAQKNQGEVVRLTKREMEVLAYLHHHHERPVAREELLAQVWGYLHSELIETRTVDIHIAKIRKKLETDPATPQLLVTIRGSGYRLQSEADPP
ncbi:MAG: response regulator transcription factor [Pseudomonadota bacterium]